MYKQINYKSSTINYKLIGKGPTVLLLHGFAEDNTIWKYQIEFLKNYYQLIIPDIAGSGNSTVADWHDDFTIDYFAESIKAILDKEKITSCTVIGHSMGGYITLALAEKYPDLLNGFGLFHSTAFADSADKKQTRLKAINFIKDNGAYAFIKTTTPNLFAETFKQAHVEQINSLVENGKRITSISLIRYYQAMINRPDRTNILSNFLKPILFILGEYDKAIPLQDGLQQCYLPQQAFIHILKHSGHMGLWEEVDKSNTILLDFLTAIERF